MPNNFSYNLNLPISSNNPSVDAPNMAVNTNSISSLIGIDHVGFNTNGSGIHNQVTIPVRAGSPTLGDGNAVLYCKQYKGLNAVWIKDIAQDTPLNGPSSPNITPGYTTLYGGTILQWGTVTGISNPSTNTVTFPFTFITGCFSVHLTPYLTGTVSVTTGTSLVLKGIPTLAGFGWAFKTDSTATNYNFFWSAIGY